jgi:predicted small lipoprotein YifL
MKNALSLLLGVMLLTSLAGFAYAAPIYQPTDNGNNCNPNTISTNPNATQCGGNSDGAGPKNSDPHPGNCPGAKENPDVGSCCEDSSNPLSPDATCCNVSVNPQNPQISDLQPDFPVC